MRLVALIAAVVVAFLTVAALFYDGVIVPAVVAEHRSYVQARIDARDFAVPKLGQAVVSMREVGCCIDASMLNRASHVLVYDVGDATLRYELLAACPPSARCERTGPSGLYLTVIDPVPLPERDVESAEDCIFAIAFALDVRHCEVISTANGDIQSIGWASYVQPLPFDPFPKSFRFGGMLEVAGAGMSRQPGLCDDIDDFVFPAEFDRKLWCAPEGGSPAEKQAP